MDTPKFVGVVFDGDGSRLETILADTKEECERFTLVFWQGYQTTWENADQRPDDPPMWDTYERIRLKRPW